MQYMVVGPDGNEYGPASVDTLKQWAAENRISPSTQLRSFETGQSVLASSLTDIYPPQPVTPGVPPPAAGGAWSQPPSPSNYTRPAPSGFVASNSGGSDVVWAIVRSGLAIVLFFVFHGLGLIVGGYAIFYAIRGHMAGHKLGWLAILISSLTFIAIGIGWMLRLSNGGV